MLWQILQVHQVRRMSLVSNIRNQPHKSVGREFRQSILLRSKETEQIPDCHFVQIPLRNLNRPITMSSATRSLERGLLRTPLDLNARQYPAQTPCIAQTRQIE